MGRVALQSNVRFEISVTAVNPISVSYMSQAEGMNMCWEKTGTLQRASVKQAEEWEISHCNTFDPVKL